MTQSSAEQKLSCAAASAKPPGASRGTEKEALSDARVTL
jgi:hypothetical protein